MSLGPHQPGTFSPLTISIPVLASTFSTVPRNVCSPFLLDCAARAFDGALEGVPSCAVLAIVPPDCACRSPTRTSEKPGRHFDPSETKPRIAADTKKAALSLINFRSEEHTSELQSHLNLVCRLLLEKKKKHS